jgi:hypothetical protein
MAADAAGLAAATVADKFGQHTKNEYGRGAFHLAADFFGLRQCGEYQADGSQRSSTTRCTMSNEKSVIVLPTVPKRVCPICGKAAYSAGGIHPQCAIEQADRPRVANLRAARAAELQIKPPLPDALEKQVRRVESKRK